MLGALLFVLLAADKAPEPVAARLDRTAWGTPRAVVEALLPDCRATGSTLRCETTLAEHAESATVFFSKRGGYRGVVFKYTRDLTSVGALVLYQYQKEAFAQRLGPPDALKEQWSVASKHSIVAVWKTRTVAVNIVASGDHPRVVVIATDPLTSPEELSVMVDAGVDFPEAKH